MNEEQTIKKITLLKSVQPQQVVLNDIKRGVYHQVGIGAELSQNGLQRFFAALYQSVRTYRLAFGATIAILIIVLPFLTALFFSDQVHMALLTSNISVAANHYEKAKIALSDLTHRYDSRRSSAENISGLSQELALTNTQLSELKLKGESGKYTQSECHALYQQYSDYLKKENARIPNQPQFSSVKAQISTYQEQAEKKLNKYSHM